MKISISNIHKLAKYQVSKIISQPCDLECVFIVGVPRSGTTLLQSRVGAHSSFISIQSETGFFRPNFYLSERGEPFSRWGGVVQQFQEFVKITSGGLVFVEKTPQHIKNLAWILRYFPNAKFVHVFRDPRDCFASAQSNINIKHRDSPEKFSRYYNTCIGSRFRVAIDNPRVKDVCYEHLVDDPAEILDEIMRFLGSALEYQQLSQMHDPRGCSRAFEKLNGKIDNRSVGQWRKKCAPEVAEKIWRKSGGMYLKALADFY